MSDPGTCVMGEISMRNVKGKNVEAKKIAESRSILYVIKGSQVSGLDSRKRYVLKVYHGEKDRQSGSRLPKLVAAIRKGLSIIESEYPEVREVIGRTLPIDWGYVIDSNKCIPNISGTSAMYPAAIFEYLENTKPILEIFSGENRKKYNDLIKKHIKKIVLKILVGVYALHESGVVHADLARDNILINIKTGEVFIIDLDGGGLIRHRGGWSLRPLVVGKTELGFVNPPEVRIGRISWYSDIWRMAQIVHWVLLNASPYYFLSRTTSDAIGTAVDIIRRSGIREWPPPYDILEKIPDFNRALSRDKIERRRMYLTKFFDTELFYRTFVDGYYDPTARPTAKEFLMGYKKAVGYRLIYDEKLSRVLSDMLRRAGELFSGALEQLRQIGASI